MEGTRTEEGARRRKENEEGDASTEPEPEERGYLERGTVETELAT